MKKRYENNMEEDNEDNINPLYGKMETRYGALKVPEVNEQTANEVKLKPILKFDDWGNEINEQ